MPDDSARNRLVELTPELVQQISGLAGLELTLERAAEILPALKPSFEGDAGLAKLGMGNLSPVGSTWSEDGDE